MAKIIKWLIIAFIVVWLTVSLANCQAPKLWWGAMKRIIFLILALTMLLGIIPTQSIVYAQGENTTYLQAFEKTNVLDDLNSSASFNPNNYPANEFGEIGIINFVEFGYSETGAQDNYGLFVYVYNPQQLDIDKNSVQNKIQMAIGYNTDGVPNNYFKFQLQFLNSSDNLFLKFKVVDTAIEGSKFFDRVNKEERRYDISGIELLESSKNLPEEYGIGGTWKFTGYAQGFALDVNAESTLKASVNELETIQLEVESTFYRPDSLSELGKGHQNTLSSVYFAVDNEKIEKYGKLQKIMAEWYEYKTNPILITQNNEVYNYFNNLIGQNVNEHEAAVEYGLGYNELLTGSGSSMAYYDLDWSYNLDANNNHSYSEFLQNTYFYSKNIDEYLYYAFYTANVDYTDFILNGEILEDYIYNYNLSYDKGTLEVDEKISADLFSDEVDAGRTKGYNRKEFDSDGLFDILSYDSTHSGWDKFWSGLWGYDTNEEFKNVQPIYAVTDKDMLQTDSNLSKNLLINEDDIEDFRYYYSKATQEDKTVFLFRFAVTDYHAEDAIIYKIENNNLSRIRNQASVVEETVFLSFDIIQLTFNKEGIYTVIPVVASPINIISDLTPPLQPNLSWLRWLLIALAVIVLIIILAPFLPTIFKGLWEIIKFIFKIIIAPFKWIASLFKGGKKWRK